MMQKTWFKLFIWITSTSFFFMITATIISFLNPEPSEEQIKQFMAGMMSAMHNSLMGLSMTIEHDFVLKSVILNVSSITIPLIFISILCGIIVRLLRGQRNVR